MAAGSPFVSQRFTKTELAKKARKLRKESDEFKLEAERINARSINKLANLAIENLETSIAKHGRPGSTGQLKEAIATPGKGIVHAWGYDGFDFMLWRGMYRRAKYWRVIEEGTATLVPGFVGSRFPLSFKAGNNRFVAPSQARYPRDTIARGLVRTRGRTKRNFTTVQFGRATVRGQYYGSLAGASTGGGRTAGRNKRPVPDLDTRRGGANRQYWVRITHDIKPYHYAANAVTRFQRSGFYTRQMAAAMKAHPALGGKVTTGGSKSARSSGQVFLPANKVRYDLRGLVNGPEGLHGDMSSTRDRVR